MVWRLCVIFTLCIASVDWLKAEDRSAVASEPTLKSIYSGVHRLEEFQREGTQAIVLAFLDTDCPIARNYVPRLAEIYARFRDRGIDFEFEDHGPCHSVYISDPDGHTIEITTYDLQPVGKDDHRP